MFVTDGAATRVMCPHCRAINNLAGTNPTTSSAKNSRPNIVLNQRPNYTLEEASSVSRQLLYENTSDYHNGWELISVNFDNVISCYSKCYCLDKEKNEVFCTKAVARIPAEPSVIADVYWNVNQELNWNSSTVQAINILEDRGFVQLIYQQHKTTSAATMKNDVNYRRERFAPQQNGAIWIYSVSEGTIPETRPNFRRGWIVFGGFLVEPSNDGFSQVSLIWCWDFNGFIHEKFITEEKKRVALRLSKLAVQVAEYVRNPKALQTVYNTAPKPTQTTSYPTTSVGASQLPSKPAAKEGALRGCKDCRIPEAGNYCSRCGNPTGTVCGRCYTTTLYSGANCSNCGNKLRDPDPAPSE